MDSGDPSAMQPTILEQEAALERVAIEVSESHQKLKDLQA